MFLPIWMQEQCVINGLVFLNSFASKLQLCLLFFISLFGTINFCLQLPLTVTSIAFFSLLISLHCYFAEWLIHSFSTR